MGERKLRDILRDGGRLLDEAFETVERTSPGELFDGVMDVVVRTPGQVRQREALEREFARSVRERDATYLRDAVVQHADVVREMLSQRLYGLHARGAIIADKPGVAYDSLKRLITPTAEELEMTGLVESTLGKTDAAAIHLRQIPLRTAEAHLFLGALAFNQGRHSSAGRYFSDAVRISPADEQSRLAVVRNTYISGGPEKAMAMLAEFYVATGSTMKAPEVMRELQRTSMNPVAYGKPLSRVADPLI